MKVSVIVPVYKVEEDLRSCIDSLVRQTHRDIEIILVDDGSPDRCGAICDEYAARDDRIVVIHKENGGVSSARNRGIEHASGDWITFVDADDTVEPDTYEQLVCCAQKFDTDVVFYSADWLLDGRYFAGPPAPSGASERIYDDLSRAEAVHLFFSRGSSCLLLVSSDVIKGKISFREGMPYCEDSLFRVAIYMSVDRFAFLPRELYHYRVRYGSASHELNLDGVIKSVQELRIGLADLRDRYHASEVFERVANAQEINITGILISRAIDSLPFKQAAKVIDQQFASPEYQRARRKCDPCLTIKMMKILIGFRKPPFMLLWALVKIKWVRDALLKKSGKTNIGSRAKEG